MKALIAFGLILAAIQEKEKPLQALVDDDIGFVLNKPKGEDWEVKKLPKGLGGIVAHKTESFTIRLTLETKSEHQKFNPLKDAADRVVEKLSTDAEGKPLADKKVLTRKSEESKFPGNGGPKAWYLDLLIREGDKESSSRYWIFVDKTNTNNMYQFEVSGADDLHKKFQKEAGATLGSFRTFRVKNK